MYAAFLKGVDPRALERDVLGSHIARRPFASLADAAREADQTGEFDPDEFTATLADCLERGAFRLVLVLDEAPAELVQLVGYLESVSSGVIVDLITVSTYEVGEEQILVPQRVDPEHAPEVPVARRSGGLASLKSVLGDDRQILLLWLPAEKAGLVSIWNDNGASISLWRSAFARRAWEQIEPIEELTGKPMGQGSAISNPAPALLDLLTAAYESPNENPAEWDGHTFGEGPNRSWDDAREFGFVAAGGGAWYSKTLKQLQPGNRVFAYIPKGSGVGGYVGFGEVTGPAVRAKDFIVERDGQQAPITDVARADMARGGTTGPDLAEWVVPVSWSKALRREDAIKDSDFFANQNCAVRLTHGYTLKRLGDAFGLED